MNRIFRLVWNESLNAYVPAAETARGRGKSSKRKLVAAALSLSVGIVQAGPTGGQVTAGNGAITQSGATTTIRQSSQNLSLNWQTFNIAPQETVDFVQPNSTAVAVNRILDPNGSVIMGHLNANGQVYLINPNGVIFGKGAEVNVGGLVASTLDLDPSSTGNAKTFTGTGSASILNEGTITAASGGAVALLGNHVGNTGTISAQLGSVALGAGSAATLTFSGTRLVSMQVEQSVLDSVASNGGLIRADGGQVLMTAGAQKSLLTSVVNNTGIIEARTLQNHEGTIALLGGRSAGTVDVSGTLDASAPNGGSGGFVETSAAHVEVASSARVTTAAAMGLNGTWLIDPTDFTVSAGATPQGASGIGASTLESELTSGNVSLATSAGGSQNGDINVNAPVSWSSNTLTLTAANNINVNAVMSVSGTAKVDFEPGVSGNLVMGFAPDGTFAGRVDISSTAANALTISGQVYTVINSLGSPGSTTSTDLQGINGNLAGYFALGSNIDAGATSGWNSGAGFTPIDPFAGIFDGLGHAIGNLSIDTPSNINVGLFGTVTSSGIVRNVGLNGGTVTGLAQIGSLVGVNSGQVESTYSSVMVTAGHLVGTGISYAGGLVGFNYAGAIVNSNATGNVQATGSEVGGLVGVTHPSTTVSNSYATGTVSGTDFSGGLVGKNGGSITNSYATGSVTGALFTGGLAGTSYGGNVANSYATGSVQGSSYVGGLIGGAAGTVTNSYATGSVQGSTYVGGLIGFNWSELSNSYASGSVSGTIKGIGGLAGGNYGLISSSHATGNVTGSTNVGGLVGLNYGGTITQSYATGIVSGGSNVGGLVGGNESYGSNAGPVVPTITQSYAMTGTVTGTYNVGGLVGANYGSITSSYATTGAISGTNNVGGLVGYNDSAGTIATSYASANVTGGNVAAGGLVGANYGAVSASHATGAVSGGSYVGGLVGENGGQGAGGPITNSYATGNVTGANEIGGLVGYNANGTVTNSYALGNVVGTGQKVGGLVGESTTQATISGTFATGSVTVTGGGNFAGGLVGWNYGTISNSYATGSVSGADYVGGLVGLHAGTISNTYALGDVNGTGPRVGGLLGANYGLVTNSFYSSTANPSLTGFGSYSAPDSAGTVVGMTTAQLQAQSNFTTPAIANGNVAPGWDFAGTWFMYEGNTTPLLQVFMTPLTVTSTVTQTYNGAVFAPTIGNLTYSIVPDVSHLFGSLTVAGTAVGASHAGTYSFTPGGIYSDQLGYMITYGAGSLTINQALLTVVGSTANKVYDGTTVAALTGMLAGVFGGDTVTLTQAGTFASKNVGTGIAITANDSIGGASAGDYTLVEPAGVTGTITPAILTVNGTTGGGKTYNGTTAASLTGGLLVGVIGGDTVTLTQTGSFASKNAATGIAITASDSIGGASAGDYTLVEPTGVTGTIAPAILTVNGSTVGGKTYNGTTAASLTGGSLVGVIGGDTVTLTQGGSFASKDAGTGIAVTAADGLGGSDASDYTIVEPTGLAGTITPVTLTVSGTTVGGKTYNGTTAASLTGGSLVGVIGGDTVTLTQAGTFASAGVGSGIAVTATDSLSGTSAFDYSLIEPTGLTGSILPESNPPSSSSGLVLAALNARTQIVENFIYPELGANPQVIDPSPTIAVLATAAESASEGVTGSHQAIAVNVSMKIGANGTLKIENGGLRLPSNLVIGNE